MVKGERDLFNVATFRKRNKKEVWLHSLNKSIFGVLTKVFLFKGKARDMDNEAVPVKEGSGPSSLSSYMVV